MTWSTERDWRWCSKCQGLWYEGNGAARCPAGNNHSKKDSDNYSLVYDATSAPGESNWRRCKRCQGLWFAGNAVSRCPVGDAHQVDQADDKDYTIATDATGGGQKGWRWCQKCQGLWYGLENTAGKCPGGS